MNVIIKSNKSIDKQMQEDGTEYLFTVPINGEDIQVKATTIQNAVKVAKSIVKKRDAMKSVKTKK